MGRTGDVLVWIDLEMTGLDPDRCHILEIASLVTDSGLQVLDEGPSMVVHNDEEQLATLSDWCRETFGRSGLIERARASQTGLEEAESRTLAFLKRYTDPGTSPLCGNSVHNDRAFLYRRMPRLHGFLHYRNVDVSSVKELVRRWYPGLVTPPPKADRHQALLDIRESVEELRYYRDTFFRPRPERP